MSSKLREALNKIGNISAWVAENCNDQQTAKYMNDIIAIVQESVAEPVRNCEVGTAKDQYARFEAYCDNEVCNRKSCGCSCKALYSDECALEWSQMPYESEVE